MSNQLQINLNEDYKSFKSGFNTTLEGNLIILTGVNGSGKSQLLDIIKMIQSRNQSIIRLNNEIITPDKIIKRSFVEQLNIKSFATNISNYYNRISREIIDCEIGKLQSLNQFSLSYNRFKEISKNKIFQLKESVSDELIKPEYNDFVWQPNDIFGFDDITEVIYSYLLKRLVFQANTNGLESKSAFNEGKKPIWIILNEQFEKLNFNYRFRTDYEININDTKIIGGLGLTDANNIDITFGVDSFSDGEKAIFGLILASIKNKEDKIEPKILLLDEYDATFNPSLTEAFYKILVEFFVKQDVTVILTTHNPITATFAPTDIEGYQTTFYEIYKESENPNRIVQKSTEELWNINEVKRVLENFYPQVEEIKKENERLKKIETELNSKVKSLTKSLIVTEGKTDWKHCLSALKYYYHLNNEYTGITEDFFWKNENGMGDATLKNWLTTVEQSDPTNKIIGIYDNDNPKVIQLADLKNGLKNVYSFKITTPKIYKKMTYRNFWGDRFNQFSF